MPRTLANKTFTVTEFQAFLAQFPGDVSVRVTYEGVVHGIQARDFTRAIVDGVDTLMLDAEQY